MEVIKMSKELEAFNGNLKDYFLTKAPQSYMYVYYKG